MTIEGNYSITAPASDVWKFLMDPDVLLRITPGLSQLNELEEDKYLAIINLKIGPVKGSFEGQLELKDKIENTSTTLAIEQKSKIGNVSAEITMQLDDNEDNTEISYKGEAKMTGKLAMMGQRIIGGVVSSLSKQFFKSLSKEISASH